MEIDYDAYQDAVKAMIPISEAQRILNMLAFSVAADASLSNEEKYSADSLLQRIDNRLEERRKALFVGIC